MKKKQVNVDNVEDFKALVAAQARVAVYEATIKGVLAAQDKFDDVEDFASALVEALMSNAGKDVDFVKAAVARKGGGKGE